LVSAGAHPDAVTARVVQSLLDGQGFAPPGSLAGTAPTALRMPATPVLLALAGVTGSPLVAARFLWALLGGTTVVLTGLAGRRLFDRRTGLVAAGIVALWPEVWLDGVRLLSPTVAAALVAAVLLITGSRSAQPVALRRVVAAGVAAGLLALALPWGLLLLGALLGGLLLCAGAG